MGRYGATSVIRGIFGRNLSLCLCDVFADEISEGNTGGTQVVARLQEGIEVGVHVADNSANREKTLDNLLVFIKHLHFNAGAQSARNIEQPG